MTTTELTQTAHNIIDGEAVAGSGESIEVFNPATGEQIAQVAGAGISDVDAAIEAAAFAFQDWSRRPLGDRVRYLYRFKAIIEENVESLARTLTTDQGKTLAEARGEVGRAVDFIETAIAAPMLYHSQGINITTGLDAQRVREPLGVCAAVTPLNFPIMNPAMFTAWALVTGNTLVIKPSENVPLATSAVIRLLQQTGLPAGVLSLVHGRADVAKRLITHPEVKAVSCITSSATALAIYTAASAEGKRVQANGGAKNPIVVAPDADLDLAARGVVSSAFGMAGQRCLAGSRLVVVGEIYDELMGRVVDLSNELVLGNGLDERVTLGPVVSRGSKERIERGLQEALDLGAELLLDGRGATPVTGEENGYYVGPSLVTGLDPKQPMERTELFGPVINVHHVGSLDEAIDLSNNTEFGNAASVFTRSGSTARDYAMRVHAGNIGINAFPAPPANVTMGGYGASFYGDSHVCGDAPLDFYTDQKLLISRW